MSDAVVGRHCTSPLFTRVLQSVGCYCRTPLHLLVLAIAPAECRMLCYDVIGASHCLQVYCTVWDAQKWTAWQLVVHYGSVINQSFVFWVWIIISLILYLINCIVTRIVPERKSHVWLPSMMLRSVTWRQRPVDSAMVHKNWWHTVKCNGVWELMAHGQM